MFAKPPKAEEMAMFGLTVEEATVQAEVWPDDVETVNTFIAMETQWRIGMSGPTGLDYAALPAVLKMMDIGRKRHAYVFEGLRVMEEQALEEMQRLREDAEREAEVKRRMAHGSR